MPDEEFVKCPQRRKTECDRRPPQVLSSKKTEVAAEIIALKFFPRRRRLALVFVPKLKFRQRQPVIPLRIGRRPAVRRQMRKELLDPLVTHLRRGFRF